MRKSPAIGGHDRRPGFWVYGVLVAVILGSFFPIWWSFLIGLFPKNFLCLGASTTVTEGVATTSVSFNVLQILVIAVAVGIAALKVGKAAEPFLNLNASALAVIQKVLWWIIRIAPIGTVGLIGNAVAIYG